MCIFGNGKAQCESTPAEKNLIVPYLVRNLAIVPIHATNLSFKLFPHRRALVRRLYHDDHAIRAVVVLYLLDLLGLSASEASAFAPDCASARLWIYRQND